MNILQPYAEVWEQKYGCSAEECWINMQKQVELAGRTCYKSDDKITDESYIKFVGMLEKNKHTAMFEHGTVYLTIVNNYGENTDIIRFFRHNKYSKVVERVEIDNILTYYITTNFRVLVENIISQTPLKDLIMEFVCAPTQFHEKRITVHFATDIGVTREANRHRVDSVAEQSTRYCNYGKDKFGGEISINQPSWITDDMLKNLIKILSHY